MLVAIAGILAVLVVGGLVFWLIRSPSEDGAEPPSAAPAEPTTAAPSREASPAAQHEAQLQRLLPPGYPADACHPAPAPKDALAQVNCERNVDPGGPLAATFTLFAEKAALDAAFNEAIATAQQVNCPGNIQSPGPWRRNATPDRVSGTLYCGTQEGRPTVAWSDDTKLVLSAVRSGPQGPTFPELYAWWSSHS
ncbi:hypothetical protein [Mycolicibacterium sp. XJ1819]